MYQYKRAYSLVLGEAVIQSTGYITSAYDVVSSLNAGTGVLIRDLNVKFKITKNIDNGFKTNKAEIKVYNLSDKTLNKIQHGLVACQFSCGYLGEDNQPTSWDTLITGNVYQVSTTMEGVDKVTTLLVGEEFVVLNNTRVVSTIPKGKTIADVVDYVRQEMGVAKGTYSGLNKDTPLMYGYPLEGSARDQLTEICRAYNMKWWLTDNKLYIDDSISSPKLVRTYVLGKDTGLIGIPYFDSEKYKVANADITSDSGTRIDSSVTKSGKEKKFGKFKREGLKVKALLNPHLRPGDLIKMEAGSVSFDEESLNYYQINEITYSGEFRGNDWFIDMICDQVKVLS